MNLSLEITDENGAILAESMASEQVSMVYEKEYISGDTITLRSSEANCYLIIQLDDALNPEFVYMKGKEYRLAVPLGEKKLSYSPKSFSGQMHVLTARLAMPEEVRVYKNLARNVYDQHENEICFPHAHANVETRGEAIFAARNAIDGNSINYSHGNWPFESWGINKREDAEITVDFGRSVIIDKIAFTIRADFPHDNYWESVIFTFSDGSKLKVELIKTDKPQIINLDKRKVEWVTVGELIKSNDPSPFPALTQLEIFGYEA